MEHTYLRYECADSFGLNVVSGSSKAPPSNDILKFMGTGKSSPLLTIAGSEIVATNLKTCERVLQIGHREKLTGGMGTGKALNSDEVTCLDVRLIEGGGAKVATGWVNGTVRVFDLEAEEVNRPHHGLAHSLIEENDDDDFTEREPLVLNGHESPVRAIVFDTNNRLATGGSDGAVVIWDITAECGLFRLIGHRGGVTSLKFVELGEKRRDDLLFSTSLDGLVKVWDLDGQCCIQTIASHRGELWSSSYARLFPESGEVERRRLVTGGIEGRAKVWSVEPSKRHASEENSGTEAAESDLASSDDVCRYIGELTPPANISTSAEKITCVNYHPTGKFLGILQNNSKNVDIYITRSLKDANKKRQRRLKRKQEKRTKRASETANSGQKRGMLDDDVEPAGEEQIVEPLTDSKVLAASDEFEYVGTARASHKIRCFQFCPGKEKGELTRIICALSTNSLEVVALEREKKENETTLAAVSKKVNFDRYGHPTGIRGISLSSDDRLACTISKNAIKVWNVSNRTIIQSLQPTTSSGDDGETCYGLCGLFLPGNAHVVVGTREGHLLTIDISAGEVIDVEKNAHDGAIWAIDVRRSSATGSGVSVVTGSADKMVKFWDVESDEDTGIPILVHSRTLQMTDDVVAVRFSSSMGTSKRMVFVSTLDSTIKVFFEDSLKLFLNLYGHKLPALTIDASDDDVLLASSGADKTIKLWGLDFGDTHRTLHGHQDSVTDLRFVQRTHNFFSVSKDGTVRYWDGDRFEQILLLRGHLAEINCLALSRTGAFLLSGGMDRQVRVWERTQDIVFLAEERTRELESTFDKIGRDERGTAEVLRLNNEENDDAEEPQSEAAVRKSVLSVSSGDRIIEGLERADAEHNDIVMFKKQGHGSKPPNPLLLGFPPAQYMLWILKTIPAAELEQSLLVLPFNHIERLIFYIISLMKEGRAIDLCSRVGLFLVKAHQNQLIGTRSMTSPLHELKRMVKARLAESRDVVGYNMAAMRMISRIAEEKRKMVAPASPTKDIWAGLGVAR